MTLFNSKKYLAKGFTLIFAVLVGSLIVAIGVAISNIALKELAISAISRESQIAFYAADSGAECAIYWDVQGPYLDTPFYFASPDHGATINGRMFCGASIESLLAVPVNNVDGSFSHYENRFIVHFGNPSPCAIVYVNKGNDDSRPNIVKSNGINDCSATNNPFRVERSLQIEYR